jgi:hypothetical protein
MGIGFSGSCVLEPELYRSIVVRPSLSKMRIACR